MLPHAQPPDECAARSFEPATEPTIDRSILGEWLGDDESAIDLLLAEFRDSIRAEYTIMIAALGRDDMSEYGQAVHRLRGAALSMGANPLARAAAVLDIAARAKDPNGCREGIPELEIRLREMVAHAPCLTAS